MSHCSRLCILTAAALAVGMVFTLPATAFQPSAEWQRCTNATTTNYEWQNCGAREIARREAKLQVAWKKALSCFDDASGPTSQEAKQKLIAEERLWIKWKDASCGVYGSNFFGREGYVLGFAICRAKIIADQTQNLLDIWDDCRPK